MKKIIKSKTAIVLSGIVAALLGMAGAEKAQAASFVTGITGVATDDTPRSRDVGLAYKGDAVTTKVQSVTTMMGGEEVVTGGPTPQPRPPGTGVTTMMAGEEVTRPNRR